MEFIIAVIGGFYLIMKFMSETGKEKRKKLNKEQREIRLKEIDSIFWNSHEKAVETLALSDAVHINDSKSMIEDNINAILKANPNIKERHVLKKYSTDLFRAKFGLLDPLFNVKICGGEYDKAEVIEFAHQVELLLNKAGIDGELLYFTPGFGVDIDNEEEMWKGAIVLKVRHEVFYPDSQYKRLW